MNKDPCTKSPECCSLPAEFVRLRYFFGQRLNVVDFTDEQRYLVGKQRFHNARAHGSGVLCGLRARRYVFPAGAPVTTPTKILEVSRGAAIDGCGREIVVGWSHCVDVAAWFRKHVDDKPDLAGWRSGAIPAEERRLWVAVCYRECESDPAVAPRDPCGCDPGGCEFSRVREGFTLELLTESELDRVLEAPSPSPWSALEAVPDSGVGEVQTQGSLASPTECLELDPAKCLALASVLVVLDSNDEDVEEIGDPDNAIEQRLSLVSTGQLQASLAQLSQALGAEAVPGPGPRFGSMSFSGPDGVSGTLGVSVDLVDDGMGPVALAGDPLPSLGVSVHRFNDDGTWTDVTPSSGDISFAASPQPEITLSWNSGLENDGRYRLVIEASDEPPVVDFRMRPLMPRRFVRHFRLQTNASSTLEISPTLYDA